MSESLARYMPAKAEDSDDKKPTTIGCFNAQLNHPMQIVKRYAGLVGSMKGSELDFNQLVSIIKQLQFWQTNDREEFVAQFLDYPDLLNAKCSEMVYAFCHLKWNMFSHEMQAKFVDFLVNVASFNPIHVNFVLRSIVINCLNGFPEQVESPDEEQHNNFERTFELGLQAMYRLVPPSSAYGFSSTRIPELSALLGKMKPFKRAPLHEFYLYIRLLITFCDKYSSIAKELWFNIIDCLIKFDSEVSNELVSQQANDLRHIFPKRDENIIDESDSAVNEARRKLDVCMTMVFCYISLDAHEPRIQPSDYVYTQWMKNIKPCDDVFVLLSSPLEAQVLTVYELENVPFIWFYMCLEDESILERLLEYLWQLILKPYKSPNDWKKMHNAVAFMAGILARGDFASIDVAKLWLEKMIEWCVMYVKNAGQVKHGGGIQHSTFYAIVQSAFFLLCFRYKEFNESKMAEEVHTWGISRIVHSQLEPLNFIPRNLALFFASISRYMQIVYCSHIVNMHNDQVGVETCFPYLRHGLIQSARYFQSHLRVFQPIENDLATINSIRSRRTTEVANDENDYDFMEEDDGIEIDCE
ncbi:hypothetical protein M3Y97_00057900 [Aphelenchoides bicaudatus]|nr:hypothetical protein M3Y97_00057900 [Aphelenchoides bicaudatus]